MLARLAQRQREQVLLDERLRVGRVGGELLLDLGKRDLLVAAENEQALRQVLELAQIAGPRVIAQAILRGHAEPAKRQRLGIDEQVDVPTQQLRNVLRVLAQRRDAYQHDREVREQRRHDGVAAVRARQRA